MLLIILYNGQIKIKKILKGGNRHTLFRMPMGSLHP